MEIGRQNDLVVACVFATAHSVPAEQHQRDDEHDAQHGELHDAAEGIGGLGSGPGHAVGRGQLGHGVRGYKAPEAEAPQCNERVAGGDGKGHADPLTARRPGGEHVGRRIRRRAGGTHGGTGCSGHQRDRRDLASVDVTLEVQQGPIRAERVGAGDRSGGGGVEGATQGGEREAAGDHYGGDREANGQRLVAPSHRPNTSTEPAHRALL